MNTQGPCGAAEIAAVGTNRGCDELLFELVPSLFEGNTLANQLVYDEIESVFEI